MRRHLAPGLSLSENLLMKGFWPGYANSKSDTSTTFSSSGSLVFPIAHQIPQPQQLLLSTEETESKHLPTETTKKKEIGKWAAFSSLSGNKKKTHYEERKSSNAGNPYLKIKIPGEAKLEFQRFAAVREVCFPPIHQTNNLSSTEFLYTTYPSTVKFNPTMRKLQMRSSSPQTEVLDLNLPFLTNLRKVISGCCKIGTRAQLFYVVAFWFFL